MITLTNDFHDADNELNIGELVNLLAAVAQVILESRKQNTENHS